jgi:hypothetical protein
MQLNRFSLISTAIQRGQTLKICLPNDPRVTSINCLAVEFDDVAVGVDYIDLRVAC